MAVAVAGVLVVVLLAGFVVDRVSGWRSDSSIPTITKVQELGDLVVLRVSVADVHEAERYEYKGIWIFRGDADVAVDLKKARLKSANKDTKTLVVELPTPRVIRPRVDHEKSQEYEVTRANLKLWTGDKSRLSTEGWREAQRKVEKATSDAAFIDQGREQAKVLLTGMYSMVGWKVDVVWQDGWKAADAAK